MKNFFRLSQGHDVSSLKNAIGINFWSEYPTNGLDLQILRKPIHESAKECKDQPILHVLPEALPYIFGLMAKVRGERLGTVLLVKLSPGRSILPHKDMEGMDKYYDRFHIVLQSNPQVSFHADDEEVNMCEGDIWWFNHTSMHSVYNNGTTDRVHLIIDIKLRNAHV